MDSTRTLKARQTSRSSRVDKAARERQQRLAALGFARFVSEHNRQQGGK